MGGKAEAKAFPSRERYEKFFLSKSSPPNVTLNI
jgi:hypothetical protein